MRKIEEKSKASSVQKREEKESISEILIIAPFTQDSAVVYSLTGEAKQERRVVEICFQHDWPFRALLEACLPMMKKIPCVLLLSRSTHAIVLTMVPWSCQPKAFL